MEKSRKIKSILLQGKHMTNIFLVFLDGGDGGDVSMVDDLKI